MEKTDSFASYPSLRDRVIIVTGGATGIGEAIVEAFAMQNARGCSWTFRMRPRSN